MHIMNTCHEYIIHVLCPHLVGGEKCNCVVVGNNYTRQLNTRSIPDYSAPVTCVIIGIQSPDYFCLDLSTVM